MTNDALKTIRARIDGLDEKIQTLISERAACAQEGYAKNTYSDHWANAGNKHRFGSHA